jgi:uncharacterized protein
MSRASTANWAAPQTALLADGRLHLQHGPIDLVIWADNTQAYVAATSRFEAVLGELVGDLAVLRRPVQDAQTATDLTPVACRMVAACVPHAAQFITSMAAVAGAVADEVLAAMLSAQPTLQRAYVNNGGDVAVYLAEGETLRIGIVSDLKVAIPEGAITFAQSGGVATSGWRGRSFSLGIADSVTVQADCAAQADAAATIIANAVNADHPAIRRATAHSLDPDSDLGTLLVTTEVGVLPPELAKAALAKGAAVADALLQRGHIQRAALVLQGQWFIT